MRKNRPRQSKERRYETFRLFLLSGVGLTLTLILLVFIFGSQTYSPLHRLLFWGISPIQKGASAVTDTVVSFKQEYIDLRTVREDNKRLWAQLEQYKEIIDDSREAIAISVRLQKLLDFKEANDYPTVAARIIGKDPSLWFNNVIIDRGTSDGVDSGMPVVTGAGIVGQVYEVSTDYSKVLLTIAPSSAMDVIIQNSRERGILKGTGENSYRLNYILKKINISKGDYIVTAGYGGMFPTGLPVGTVSKVIRKPRGMFLEVEVTPAVDFTTLENLLVILRNKISFDDARL